jgi:hypothetical protein
MTPRPAAPPPATAPPGASPSAKKTRPVKNVGDVEMTARGFERLTAEGFQPVENRR